MPSNLTARFIAENLDLQKNEHVCNSVTPNFSCKNRTAVCAFQRRCIHGMAGHLTRAGSMHFTKERVDGIARSTLGFMVSAVMDEVLLYDIARAPAARTERKEEGRAAAEGRRGACLPACCFRLAESVRGHMAN